MMEELTGEILPQPWPLTPAAGHRGGISSASKLAQRHCILTPSLPVDIGLHRCLLTSCFSTTHAHLSPASLADQALSRMNTFFPFPFLFFTSFRKEKTNPRTTWTFQFCCE